MMKKKSLLLLLVLILTVGCFRVGSFASAECYQQSDPRWGDARYGEWTLADSGCGILALVNAVNYRTGNFMQPQMVAQWAYENNHLNGTYGRGSMRYGLYGGVTAVFGSTYGFSISALQDGTIYSEAVISHLMSGGSVIVHVRTHFMAINAYNPADGTFLIYDSAAVAERNTSPAGTWLTAAQIHNNPATYVDWFCLVSATQQSYYPLRATAVGQGTLHFGNNVKQTTAPQGRHVYFQATPDANQHVASVRVGGTYFPVLNDGAEAVYDFYMPAGGIEVEVIFEPNDTGTEPYYVVAAANGQGTVHFGGGSKWVGVNAGQQIYFQTTPEAGYKVVSVDVGGTAYAVLNNGGDAVYSFCMPEGSVRVTAVFGPA